MALHVNFKANSELFVWFKSLGLIATYNVVKTN